MSAPTCSAVILSGGLSSRMAGENKAFIQVGNKPIIDRVSDTLKEFFHEILIVTRDPRLYCGRKEKVVVDIFDIRSSLTGIHAGLVNSEAEYAFFVACDTPFLRKALLESLLNELDEGVDIIVPVHNKFYEPLCAIYSKSCIPHIESQLRREDLMIIHLFDKVRVREVTEEQLRKADPELLSFFNINTPEALRKTRTMLSLL